MTSKKRGAPRGNHNAFKHGFYSSAFKEQERRLLAQLSPADLSAEVDLLRIAMFRFVQALNASTSPLDAEAQLSALRALTLGTHSIARLLRTERWMSTFTEPTPELHRLGPRSGETGGKDATQP